MNKTLNYYAKKFAQLRVSRSKGVAPHKPILLLSVIELIEQGEIEINQIVLSPELIATFLKLWKHLGSNSHHADIGLPFFHLRSDEFWHHKAKPGFEALVNSDVKIRSLTALGQAVQYAYLDEELFELLTLFTARKQLIDILINTWFTHKTNEIKELLQVNAFSELQEQLKLTGGEVYQPEDLEDEAVSIVRDAAFRRVVVSMYEYRCAFCGLQMLNSWGENIVDGAHIKPFSQFYDDRIDNGISLCKNHHWAFDRFWFTINDNYTILVSEELREISPHNTPMRDFHGQSILLPSLQHNYPRSEALQWHRQAFFEKIK